jgi:hypothetical protein
LSASLKREYSGKGAKAKMVFFRNTISLQQQNL